MYAKTTWIPALFSMICASATYSGVAHAELVIDETHAVSAPRRDVGTGACGSFVQYTRPAAPLSTRQEAEALLDKPASDPLLSGRTSRLIDRINFRNGSDGAAGDFSGPGSLDDYFPYSQSPKASPSGDDTDFAARIRGYLNVTAERVGKTLSFALACDNFCSLRIGAREVFSGVDVLQSQRAIRQIRFTRAGLYPIELVYFQTDQAALLEWALADSAQPECSTGCSTPLSDVTAYGGRFNLVPPTLLFSAIDGENRVCQECGAPGAVCATGSYCGDGLCQACTSADHCGASCSPCPSDRRICAAGACVQCLSDDQCPAGRVCSRGTCAPPTRCTIDAHCELGQSCEQSTNICKTGCSSDARCTPGQICDAATQRCVVPPPGACASDSDCSADEICDAAAHRCQPAPAPAQPEMPADRTAAPEPPAGCSAVAASRDRGGFSGLWALPLFLLLARRRQRTFV
ncbi:MAG: hypothetical protein U1A78_41260 [Polyangia bacterium]